MKIFLYISSGYSCHLFLISSASVRSIQFLSLYCAHLCTIKFFLVISNFLEELSRLSRSIVLLHFFALITEKGFVSLLASFWNSAFRWIYLFFSPLPFTGCSGRNNSILLSSFSSLLHSSLPPVFLSLHSCLPLLFSVSFPLCHFFSKSQVPSDLPLNERSVTTSATVSEVLHLPFLDLSCAVGTSPGKKWERGLLVLATHPGGLSCWQKRQTWPLHVASQRLVPGSKGLPGSSVVKNPPANAGDMGSVPGSGRLPGEGNGSPFQ